MIELSSQISDNVSATTTLELLSFNDIASIRSRTFKPVGCLGKALVSLSQTTRKQPGGQRALMFLPTSRLLQSHTFGGSIMKDEDDDPLESYRRWRIEAKQEKAFYEAKTVQERWPLIRQIYEYHLDEIMEAARQSRRGGIDPYFVDWSKIFSPIEEEAWQHIRVMCLPLYPQFPVKNCFIDFANPYLKLGVEMDGKEFHDEEKDRERDQRLAKDGWQIFRIPGRECYTKYKPLGDIREMEQDGVFEDELHEALENYFMNSCEGVFKAIYLIYFSDSDSEYMRHAYRSLDAHRLASFIIGRGVWI